MKQFFTVFAVITAAFTALLLWLHNVFFDAGANRVWFVSRCLLLAGLFSAAVCAVIFGTVNRKALLPYLFKLKKYGPLLYQLVRRDFFAKYKRSVLGVLWSLLNPLLTMLVLTIVFSFLFRFDIENYPVYLLSGQIVFTLFSETTNLCMNAVTSAAALMKKTRVPKYIFPLSKAISSLINFVFYFLADPLCGSGFFPGCHLSLWHFPHSGDVFYAAVLSNQHYPGPFPLDYFLKPALSLCRIFPDLRHLWRHPLSMAECALHPPGVSVLGDGAVYLLQKAG